jgi:hypothetical protein
VFVSGFCLVRSGLLPRRDCTAGAAVPALFGQFLSNKIFSFLSVEIGAEFIDHLADCLERPL